MQALAERLEVAIGGAAIEGVDPLGLRRAEDRHPARRTRSSATRSTRVGRRAKYLIFELDDGVRLLIHLSQAGRLDIEEPPKKTRPKGAAVRHPVRQRHARSSCASTAPSARPRGGCSRRATTARSRGSVPSPDSDEFAELILHGTDKRRIHTMLRDQRTVSGHRARLRERRAAPRARLAVRDARVADRRAARRRCSTRSASTLADALERRAGARRAGCPSRSSGERFRVHNRAGTPCPECGDGLRRVSYESYEVTYCPTCQTGGKVLADRRMSRLVK